MTVNKKIQIADYNNIREKVAQVLGQGSATFGYGQPLRSSPVADGNKITINEWGNLRNDIINAFVHQNGSNPTSLSQATVNSIVKSDSDSTSFVGYISGTTLTVTSVSSGMVAVGQRISPPGVTANTEITALLPNPGISVTGVASITPVNDYFEVTLNITTQPAALPADQICVISGSTNTNYNGSLLILSSTTSTIKLKYDIDPGSYTGGTTTVRILRQDPWGYSVWSVNNSQTVSVRAMSAASSTQHPYLQYDTVADALQTNRFAVAPTQVATVNKGSTSKTWPDETNSVWNTMLSCKVTVQFTDATKARQFFNAGGAVRLASSRSGGSATAQNTAWTSLLSSAGSRTFGSQQPNTGLGANDGSNFYNLTNAYQIWYTTSSSSPYTLNTYRISAKLLGGSSPNNQNGTATGIEFLVEWIDGYQDVGVPEPGDSVDGTITLSATTVEPTGTLVPAGSGNFTVESPTVTFDNFVYSPSSGPIAPTGVSAVPGNTQATITFTPPPPSGIYPNLYYTVISTPGSITRTATSSPMVFTGLTNGTAYTFRVSATNAVATSPLSAASNSVIPTTSPGTPTIGTATFGDTTATVTFTPPAVTGGTVITGYTVLSSPENITVNGTSSPITVTGLTNGIGYSFRVAAFNATGTGGYSSPSNVVIPRGLPGAPPAPSAVSGLNASSIVTFVEPTNTGGIGIPITSYTVLRLPGNVTTNGTSSPITVTGLTNGTTYTFRVRANNSVGSGPYSTDSPPITPDISVPNAPTIGTATSGNGTASITFTAPANNGGGTITGYTMISTPGDIVRTSTTSPISYTGLTNGVGYSFRVAAINAKGTGPYSGPSNVTIPRSVPGAPPAPTAVSGRNASTIITFSEPTNTGGIGIPITDYSVLSTPGNITASGSTSPITVTGLTNGTAYTFQVRATNGAGTGAYSVAGNSIIPYTVPGAPTIGTATSVAARQIQITWSGPVNTGGNPVTAFNVYCYSVSPPQTINRIIAAPASSLIFDGLVPSRSYSFRVSAFNAAGEGPLSNISNAVTK